ncbi:hypothetical protein BDP81DRAFT_433350 [Colletotrichum phormii]|uniref:Uncharacterized protein n=1 Tax=Colletotrichum phormii TaxID=359342 RepID=A0AAJ0EEA6_9PEZI|nr:uncharacterized protein BDP81DRAFT_433350 [Colletotrichum phormii]KAK1633911.1 hypothetical protein BDP81DRAFT_433350 [Colletotrichum phormii]
MSFMSLLWILSNEKTNTSKQLIAKSQYIPKRACCRLTDATNTLHPPCTSFGPPVRRLSMRWRLTSPSQCPNRSNLCSRAPPDWQFLPRFNCADVQLAPAQRPKWMQVASRPPVTGPCRACLPASAGTHRARGQGGLEGVERLVRSFVPMKDVRPALQGTT